jgi:hypothetical protein
MLSSDMSDHIVFPAGRIVTMRTFQLLISMLGQPVSLEASPAAEAGLAQNTGVALSKLNMGVPATKIRVVQKLILVSLSHSPQLKPQKWLKKPLLSTKSSSPKIAQKEIGYDFETLHGVLSSQKNMIAP